MLILKMDLTEPREIWILEGITLNPSASDLITKSKEHG